MRAAYALIGFAWIIILGVGIYAVNHRFTNTGDTAGAISSSSVPSMTTTSLSLSSSVFVQDGSIPPKYTCDGEQVNPPLRISGVPEGAKSLALIMDDPDVPKALKPDGVFDHWVLFNIPPQTGAIPEGGSAGIAGANGAGKSAYAGPCPPPQYEPSTHRYFFKLYTLDTELPLKPGASKADVEKAMRGHIIAQTQLVGRYKRR